MANKRYTLFKTFTFEAAHRLPLHDGKCARLHGHSWVGTAILEAEGTQDSGPETGMVMDFGKVSAAIAGLVEMCLDHHYLNESLGMTSPTCESVARWVYQALKPRLPLLVAVRINETCTSACEYRP